MDLTRRVSLSAVGLSHSQFQSAFCCRLPPTAPRRTSSTETRVSKLWSRIAIPSILKVSRATDSAGFEPTNCAARRRNPPRPEGTPGLDLVPSEGAIERRTEKTPSSNKGVDSTGRVRSQVNSSAMRIATSLAQSASSCGASIALARVLSAMEADSLKASLSHPEAVGLARAISWRRAASVD